MRRKLSGVIVAVALAAVGTAMLVFYVQSATDRALAGERLVPVLVATEAIAKGTPAADLADAVKTTEVPAKVRAAGAADDLADLEGLQAAVDLVPGEQLVTARFASAAEVSRGDVPPGLHRVTVKLEQERALGGRIAAGDTVGVFLSFDPFEKADGSQTANATHLELHKVQVTGVQIDRAGAAAAEADDDDDTPDPAPGGAFLVTLALDAPSAEKVVFAAEHGFVWLSSEPADAPQDGTRVVTRGDVYGIEDGSL